MRIGNRPRHDIRGRLVRLPLVLPGTVTDRSNSPPVGTSVADGVERGSVGSAATSVLARARRSRKNSSRVCQRSGWSRSHSSFCRGDNLPMKKFLSRRSRNTRPSCSRPSKGFSMVIVPPAAASMHRRSSMSCSRCDRGMPVGFPFGRDIANRGRSPSLAAAASASRRTPSASTAAGSLIPADFSAANTYLMNSANSGGARFAGWVAPRRSRRSCTPFTG